MHQNEIDGVDSKLLDLSIKILHGIESPKYLGWNSLSVVTLTKAKASYIVANGKSTNKTTSP